MSSPMFEEVKKSFSESFSRTSFLLNKFLDECPENVWQEVFGQWPIWQQTLHIVGSHNFFLSAHKGYCVSLDFPEDILRLSVIGEKAVALVTVTTLCKEMEAKVFSFIENIDEKTLFAEHTALSKAFSKHVNNFNMIMLLNSHIMYHLGSCDSALRSKGLPGVF